MLQLNIIKTIHTIIWLFMNVVIFYMLYAVIYNVINVWFWICLGIVMAESLVLLAFKWSCPLTLIARRYSNSNKSNFDIYLPEWLARNNKLIYTLIIVAILIMLGYRLLQ